MRGGAGTAAALLWFLSAGPAPGQAPTTATLIDGMLDRQGGAWEQAREAVLDRADLVALARASVDATAYGPSTWRRLVLTEALAMHVTHPAEAERLRGLRGLNRDHYQRRRKPVPSAARELRTLRHVAPLMIELFLKGMETYPWSSPADAEAEGTALRRGLLMAIGRSGHAASVHFVIDVIEGGCACCASCDRAIAALGQTGSRRAVPVLLRVLEDARSNGDRGRHAAAVDALGEVRYAEVWPHLRGELANEDPLVREAAIRAAAAYGSRRHWTADPAEGARVRTVVGASLLDVLADVEAESLVTAVLESLSLVATPQLRESLERRLDAVSGEAVREHPGAAPPAADRLRRATARVDRALRRQGGLRERAPRVR